MIQITSNNLPSDFWNCMKESFSNNLVKQVDFNFNIKGISDIHIENDYRSEPKILPGKFNVLILWEPKAVNPWSYQKKVINKFQLVIACGQQRSQNLHINDFILHPYNFENQLIDESNREKNFVIINSAKFSASRDSLYGLKRQVIKSMDKKRIDFSLFGDNWHMEKTKELRERIWSVRRELSAQRLPSLTEAFSHFFYRYPSYKGRVENKLLELSKFKYAIVIENEADFISEKLFDAIAAKCVPIYVGPDLSMYQHLNKCVVALPASHKEILNFILNDNRETYLQKKRILDQGDKYLGDVKKFALDSNAHKAVISIISSYNRWLNVKSLKPIGS